MKKCVVVVDDDAGILQTARVLLSQYYELITLPSPSELLPTIQSNTVHAIILDMNYKPGATNCQEGLAALNQILSLNKQIAVILNTAFGDIDVAVEAMKLGAADFIVKPWDTDMLIKKVDSAIEKLSSYGEKTIHESRDKTTNCQLQSTNPSMQSIYEYVKKVSPTDASILLLGDNGTGKTMLAYQIHLLSKRNKGPFIKVDLGAIPETLFETELFGHVKGAYTDAREDKTGQFQLANGGTLFLDEITNLSFTLQSKILSAIQFKKINKIGSHQQTDLDIRLLCATNQPIYQCCEEGKFRKDLLYRINTIEVTLPPLRKRMEDIEFFAEHFLNEFRHTYQKPQMKLSKHALKELQRHEWPGNIRELQHAIERAVIVCDDKVIKPDHFSLHAEMMPLTSYSNDQQELTNMSEIEKSAIPKAISHCGGNLSKAAQELGLSRATLYRKMQKLKIH